MSEIKLNKCPFCGSEKLKIGTKVTDRRDYKGEDTITASVRCNRCHARGPTVSYVFHSRLSTSYSFSETDRYNRVQHNINAKEEAEKLATDAWNNLKGLE